MTQLVRRRSSTHGLQLARLMAIPVAAAVLGMSVLIPPTTTKIPDIPTGSIESVWNWVQSKFPYIGKTADGEPIFQIAPMQNDRVNLGTLGPKETYTTPVFEITPRFSGFLYLRERDFDQYSGLEWTASEDRVETAPSLPLKYTHMDGEITIRTYARRRYRFMPAYTKGEFTLTGGYLPNEDYANEYTLYRTYLVSNWQSLWRRGIRQDIPAPDSRYLKLPLQTNGKALSILSGIEHFSKLDTPQKASVIQRYVRESAKYDLNATTMPEGQEDFAIWFLEEAESGYCVHFATAATVLLRAAGIPARYVEGYQVDARVNNTTVVRENAAHAWVEYFLDGVGWIVMDPTPPLDTPVLPPIDSSIDTAPPGPTVTTPRPTTQPPTTTVLPTGSSQPTIPSSNTVSPGTEQSGGRTDIWNVLLVIGAGILVLIGQWLLRRSIKKRRMYTGKPNTQALARYREAVRLARWSKCPLPEALTALAEKAAFSQHALTQQELSQFDSFFAECIERMEKESLLRRIYLRLILAAY